jgi:Probable Zinc-ribbon domain
MNLEEIFAKNPSLKTQWHQGKNVDIETNNIRLKDKAWWICDASHEWEAAFSNRVKGTGCPYCAGKKVTYEDSLKGKFPDLAKEWHADKNTKQPETVSPGSHKKAWWICADGHEWESSINVRSAGSKCPYCSGRLADDKNNLKVLCPHVSIDWHPDRNEKQPSDFLPSSNKVVWWLCGNGHEWKENIRTRSQQQGCPYCLKKRPSPEYNLAILYPKVSDEWHPTKNRDLIPAEVMPFTSKRKAWWLCSKGHEWEETIGHRTKDGLGCPYCNRRKANEENSIVTTHPHLVKEWHPDRNEGLTPSLVLSGTEKKVWWRCRKGHEWVAAVNDRARKKTGCPYCAGQKVTHDNNLAFLRPDLAKQWHPSKNENLTPYDVTSRSAKKVWWICEKGHSWEAPVFYRDRGNGCSYCSHQSTSFPEQALSYYLKMVFPKIDGAFAYNPDTKESVDIYLSTKYAPLLDPIAGIAIEYDGFYYHKDRVESDQLKNDYLLSKNIVTIRIRESGLPGLSRHEKYIEIHRDLKEPYSDVIRMCLKALASFTKEDAGSKLKTLDIDVDRDELKIIEMYKQKIEEQSIASHEVLAAQWHEAKNENIDPRAIKLGSQLRVWWQCDNGHEWQTRVSHRAAGRGCPYCNSFSVGEDNNLEVLMPDLAKEWHPTKNHGLLPTDVSPGSGKYAWWICDKKHEWEARIGSRSEGVGCPYCAGKRVSSDNCLAALRPDIAAEWHPSKNGELTPKQVVPGSSKQVYWQCTNGHEWKAKIHHRNEGRAGCSQCKEEANSLETLHPDIASFWDQQQNKPLLPHKVSPGMNKAVWWSCRCGHSWQAGIRNMVRRKHKCSECKSIDNRM